MPLHSSATSRLAFLIALCTVGVGLAGSSGGPRRAWGDEVEGKAATLRILYHADLDGQFAQPDCSATKPAGAKSGAAAPGPARSPEAPRPAYAHLVATLIEARQQAIDAGEDAPLILLGGNLAAPDLLGRGFLERGAAGAAQVAALLARGGYDAIALGHHDLSLEPSVLEALVGALKTRGMPVVATNLVCDATRQPLCKTIRPYLIVRRGSATVAVVATISPSVLSGVAPAARAGLTLEDPLPALRKAVHRARALGATRVILMTQGPRDGRGLEEVDGLQRRIETRADRADQTPQLPDPLALILAGGLGGGQGYDGGERAALRLMRRDGAAPVVGTEGGAASVSNVSLPERGEAVAVEVLRPGDLGAADVETEALLAPEIDAYCARYDVAVSPAVIQGRGQGAGGGGGGTMSREDFLGYTLEVMRRRAGAEIALLNRAAVKRTPFPMTGTVSRGELHQALPYQTRIGVISMTGGLVDSLLGPALAHPRVAAVGLERAGGALRVNGRPVDKTRRYRVATIAFVASGGDAIFSPGALSWQPLEGDADLRQAVEDFLRDGTAREDGDPTIDPRTDFGAAPAERTLLVGLSDVGLDLADTRIANRPAYGDAQLTRAAQRLVKGEATWILQVRQRIHEADLRLNLRYGWTRSQPVGAPAVDGETTDLITFATVYQYRGWRARVPAPRRTVPDPYLRTALESEFTRPAVTPTQPRAFHHLELTNTAGALFTLTPSLKMRGGAGVRKELSPSAVGDAARWRPLLEAGATLAPVALASFGALAVRLEGLLDYNFIDPAGVREHQLRGNGKVSVPLLPLLFITAGLDLFAVQRQRQGWAASYDTTVGLRVHLDGAHQWL